MNKTIINIFNIIGIPFQLDQSSLILPRDILLSSAKYSQIKPLIPNLKKYFSSSRLTFLQKNAELKQKWPLLNLVRQILKIYHYSMKPIRQANGYTKDGKKLFKRLFLITPPNSLN